MHINACTRVHKIFTKYITSKSKLTGCPRKAQTNRSIHAQVVPGIAPPVHASLILAHLSSVLLQCQSRGFLYSVALLFAFQRELPIKRPVPSMTRKQLSTEMPSPCSTSSSLRCLARSHVTPREPDWRTNTSIQHCHRKCVTPPWCNRKVSCFFIFLLDRSSSLFFVTITPVLDPSLLGLQSQFSSFGPPIKNIVSRTLFSGEKHDEGSPELGAEPKITGSSD